MLDSLILILFVISGAAAGWLGVDLLPEQQLIRIPNLEQLTWILAAVGAGAGLVAGLGGAAVCRLGGGFFTGDPAVLAELGLGNRIRSFPKQLSGGQQQRVAIARALVHDPRLIICDEPTASLDAKTGHHALELLKQNALRADRCVIVVTHDSRIFSFADSISEMEDGRVVKSCPASEYHHA